MTPLIPVCVLTPIIRARKRVGAVPPRGGLDGFEIHALRAATIQQRIQINGDVASQFRDE